MIALKKNFSGASKKSPEVNNDAMKRRIKRESDEIKKSKAKDELTANTSKTKKPPVKGKRTLTEEQKNKMKEGRLKYLKEIHGDDYVPPEKKAKKETNLIVGYCVVSIEDGRPYAAPIFKAEENDYKGRISPTREDAINSYKDMGNKAPSTNGCANMRKGKR